MIFEVFRIRFGWIQPVINEKTGPLQFLRMQGAGKNTSFCPAIFNFLVHLPLVSMIEREFFAVV